MSARARIGVLGTPDGILLGRFLAAMIEAGVLIDAVILDPKPTPARDRDIHADRTGDALPPIALETLEDHALPCFWVRRHDEAGCAALVRRLELDWLVNGGTPRILDAAALAAPKHGVLNCHPGLLPAFRGASAVEWALFLDEPIGNTVHRMTIGIDEGPILLQRRVEISGGAQYRDVRVAIYRAGFALMAEAVVALQRAIFTAADFKPQDRGRSFRPIDAARLAVAKQRLADGRYRGAAALGAACVPTKESV